METGSVSRKIARGRHTTRHSELIVLEDESYIMDTPGFSSLYIDNLEKEDLKYCFPEFLPFEGMCRFNGCSHIHEPGCAVNRGCRGRADTPDQIQGVRGYVPRTGRKGKGIRA